MNFTDNFVYDSNNEKNDKLEKPLSDEQIKMINDDYKYYIKRRDEDTLADFIQILYDDYRTRDIVLENMVYNLEEANIEQFYYMTHSYIDTVEIIEKHLDYLLEKLDERKIFLISKMGYKFEEKSKLKLNNYLNKNKIKYLKYRLSEKISEMRLNERETDTLIEITCKIVDEILANEDLTLLDIIRLEPGAYSEVFEIGNKILKIGEIRQTYKIPYNRRILQPLIRVDLSEFSNIAATIEVSDKVDTNINLTDIELYELYKELREQGIIFTDIKNENLGFLLKRNEKHWKTAIANDRKAEGFIKNNKKEEPLEVGDIVIIDTDFLYKEGDKHISWPISRAIRFEEIYKREKRNSILEQTQERKIQHKTN